MSVFQHYEPDRHSMALDQMRRKWRRGFLSPDNISSRNDGLHSAAAVLRQVRERMHQRAIGYGFYIEYVDELISVCLEQGIPCDDIINAQARVKLGIEPWYGEGK